VAHSSDNALKLLSEAGVPSGRIYTARDIATDPHYSARDMLLSVPEPGLDGELVTQPGVVPKLSATPGTVSRGGPLLGEHNEDVLLAALGGELFAALTADGTI
jgi:crotonobetainyl-CoA:carnitine CoA-transferase CaiB-like acyl-CoA transferase